MKLCSPGTPGSSRAWAGGPAALPVDTARPAPRPCTMGCFASTPPSPAGAWPIVPQMYDSVSPLSANS
jgi:hypothetical protein